MLSLCLTVIDAPDRRDLFTALYEDYHTVLLRYAMSILTPTYKSYAEDVLQDTFIAVARHIEEIEKLPPERQKAFLLTITRHKAIDFLRKETRQVEMISDYECTTDTFVPVESMISDEGYARLCRLIRSLDDMYRTPLEMNLLYGMDSREIGEWLGITAKNAGVRISRAKEKLKQLLLKEEE